jgi:hypothetical protein
VPWAIYFSTYSSIEEHFISIVGLEGNRIYNHESLQLRNNGFWIWGGLATANPSKISLSQFCTISTFHMAWVFLTETMLEVNCINHNGENVVTTILNLIHFFNIQNRKNLVQKQIAYIIFVKRCPNCLQNEILHVCHLTY